MADRFDRFTERARKVLRLGHVEAKRLGHRYIRTRHLLVGLTLPGDGAACKVLADLDVARHEIRRAVESGRDRSDRMANSSVGLTPGAPLRLQLVDPDASLGTRKPREAQGCGQ